MKTKVAIYRVIDSRYESSSRLVLTLYPFAPRVFASQDVMEYLWATNPDQAARYSSQSSRWRSPRINRIRRTESYRKWSIDHQYTVRTELYGYASCYHDGRLSSTSVRLALLEAVENQLDEVRIYPSAANRRRQPHERMVYVTQLLLDKV